MVVYQITITDREKLLSRRGRSQDIALAVLKN